MSEYQYYEFQAVERRLTETQMRELRAYSTRARITPTSFINEYDFGNFKGDQNAWMEKYFDGFFYLANWGTREFQLALPKGVVPLNLARRYCASETALVREEGGKLIFTFFLEEEPSGEWIEGDGILSSLLPIRSELTRGDYRALYLGWVMSLQSGEFDDSETEPPVPPNLGQLTGPQASFVDIFCVDPDLIAAAARGSRQIDVKPPKREEVSAWVASLSPRQKDEILIKLATGDFEKVEMELKSRFQRARENTQTAKAKLRKVAELLAAAEECRSGR